MTQCQLPTQAHYRKINSGRTQLRNNPRRSRRTSYIERRRRDTKERVNNVGVASTKRLATNTQTSRFVPAGWPARENVVDFAGGDSARAVALTSGRAAFSGRSAAPETVVDSGHSRAATDELSSHITSSALFPVNIIPCVARPPAGRTARRWMLQRRCSVTVKSGGGGGAGRLNTRRKVVTPQPADLYVYSGRQGHSSSPGRHRTFPPRISAPG